MIIAAQVARSRWGLRSGSGALALALLAMAGPLGAQTAPADPEARMRRLEAEVRALQRQVFPGSDGKFFTPEVAARPTAAAPSGAPASTPVSDLLTRMESVESQISRLTAQSEETANRVAQMEAKLAALAPPPPAVAADPAAASSPAPGAGSAVPASASLAAAAAATVPAPARQAVTAKPAPAAKPAPVAKPSAQRLAAVQKIEKPQTADPADDDYSYGFRLWEAKFYPEARQQLQIFVDKYPRHKMISFGRNLLGRAYLDDGKPYEAGGWFVKNYQADKNGARAADSLLNLAEAMRQLKDTNRSCIALGEFADVYAKEAAGRLKAQFDGLRSKVKCD